MSPEARAALSRWLESHRDRAMRDGWCLFDCGEHERPIQLQRMDEMAVFPDDQSAWEHVRKCVMNRERPAIEALCVLYDHCPEEYRAVVGVEV